MTSRFEKIYINNKNTLQGIEQVVKDYAVRLNNLLLVDSYPLGTTRGTNPFFIIGSGRSGTTLLRRILSAHPDLVIPPENSKLSSLAGVNRRFGGAPWEDFVNIVYAKFEYQKDFDTFEISDLYGLVEKAISWKKNERTVGNLVDEFYKHYLSRHKKAAKRWGDKTPLNTLYLRDIHKMYPNAQYIHMVRDPYDVVLSYVRTGLSPNILHAAKRWAVSVGEARRFGERYKKQFLEISYENLVRSPHDITLKVCGFLEIDYVAGMEGVLSNNLGDVQKYEHHSNVMKPISDEHLGKGKQSMTDEEIEIVKSVVSSIPQQ